MRITEKKMKNKEQKKKMKHFINNRTMLQKLRKETSEWGKSNQLHEIRDSCADSETAIMDDNYDRRMIESCKDEDDHSK